MHETTTPTVLVVDDEQVARKMASAIFEAEGYKVFTAENGEKMNAILAKNSIDLVLLDINLPGKNGLILARELREQNDIGLIFVTSRDNDIDRILGLEIGADDYITKPFNPRELTIRARNLINRSRKNLTKAPKVTHKESEFKEYNFNGWTLDLNSHTLFGPNNFEAKLPRAEFRALQYFCEHPKLLIQRNDLMLFMMNRDLKENDRTVDVTVRKLRKHFTEGIDEANELIETIHGEGYRFNANVVAK